MRLRFFSSLAALSAAVLTLPTLHAAEPGSIAPVTLVLTATSAIGALPDADRDGEPDFEKSTSTDTSESYEFKTKFVTTKLTNAAFISHLVATDTIPDANYSLVMAFGADATPLGFFVIRKGETPLVTQPVDVSDYFAFTAATEGVVVGSAKTNVQYNANGSVKSASASASWSVKQALSLVIREQPAFGMFSLDFNFNPANNRYLVSSAKISSIAGGDEFSTLEGSINIAASQAADISLFVD
jgi:hypothetical protein